MPFVLTIPSVIGSEQPLQDQATTPAPPLTQRHDPASSRRRARSGSGCTPFDPDGLWRYQGIGFSRDGTLKATVRRLVDSAEAGRTQRELQLRLEVRVHNQLLDLVEHKQLRRESIAAQYVYVAAARSQAAKQIKQRRALVAAGLGADVPVAPTLEVEVLVEVTHGTRLPPPDAATVAARLVARGIRVTEADVDSVLERHGLEKKRPAMLPERPSHPPPLIPAWTGSRGHLRPSSGDLAGRWKKRTCHQASGLWSI